MNLSLSAISDNETQQTTGAMTCNVLRTRVSICEDIEVHQVPRVESILRPSLFYQSDEIDHMRAEFMHELKFGFLDLVDSSSDITPPVKRSAVARARRSGAPRAGSESARARSESAPNKNVRTAREQNPEGRQGTTRPKRQPGSISMGALKPGERQGIMELERPPDSISMGV
jgi:hypothetical protein